LKTLQDEVRDSRIEPEDLSDAGLPLLLDSIVALRFMGGLDGEAATTSFISSEDACHISGNGFEIRNGFGISVNWSASDERCDTVVSDPAISVNRVAIDERCDSAASDPVFDLARFAWRRYSSFRILTARNRAPIAESMQASKSMVSSSLPAKVKNDD
jgi:hypothetical protein